MFEKKSLVFYYCTTPLHMGAGTSVGAIDNPIQREVHCKFPVIAGSGLKGAIRHHVNKIWKKEDVDSLLGKETTSGELTAGAVSFTDANIFAFPVRSLKNAFVYVTCPYAIARLKRMALQAGINWEWEECSDVEPGKTVCFSKKSLIGGKLCLEALELDAKEDEDLSSFAEWLAENCLPENGEYFKDKLMNDLFIVSDEDFGYFVRNSTVVEPHVRIDDKTGTADGGALFYTENLPPESILAGMVLTSIERGNKDEKRSAEVCMKTVLWDDDGINGNLVQMGGDSTTGRGLVLINAVKGEE